MNILWLTNIPLPEASILLGEKPTPYGGWLINTSRMLSDKIDINLNIAFPINNIGTTKTLHGKKINYYAFPSINKKAELISKNPFLSNVLEETNPDIVHIFGTEFPHTLAMTNICKEKGIKVVISIQGLVSVIAKHYESALPNKIVRRYTFRDFIKRDNIKQQQIKYLQKGEFEKEALNKVNFVIGRTTWDKACSKQINPNLTYFHCNETLREEFYKNKWDIKTIDRNSIFISQGSYPIKGLHLMIEALPKILKVYPETKLFIAGFDITKSTGIRNKLKISSYGKYIQDLIKENKLENNVVFTGNLNEKQICQRYIKSHVFVCSSTIENSPNSLGEAMLLGVPCVASHVGGIPDMLKHGEEGFIYQPDAPYMLAYYITEIFSNDKLAKKFSVNARIHALKTHDPTINYNRLMEIYYNILEEN